MMYLFLFGTLVAIAFLIVILKIIKKPKESNDREYEVIVKTPLLSASFKSHVIENDKK